MLWALACEGEKGANDVLELMRRDISITFALAGNFSIFNLISEVLYIIIFLKIEK